MLVDSDESRCRTMGLRVCALEEIAAGMGRAFEVDGRVIAVFRTRGGEVHAVDNACPHRGGPLADSVVVGQQIVCPLHARHFHLRSGVCDEQKTCPIRRHPVRVEKGQVILTLPEQEGLRSNPSPDR